MNSTFLPLRPMLPSASARFTTNGMSTSVESATPMLILKLRSKNARRERMLKSFMSLLLESRQRHQGAHHAPYTLIVRAVRVRHARKGRVLVGDGGIRLAV